MTLPGVPLTEDLERYMEALLPKRDPVLQRMEKEADEQGIPAVGPQVGMLLYLLARLSGAVSILELGTAIGYSGIWLARGAAGARLVTLEKSAERAERARANFAAAGLETRVELVQQDAIAYLEKHPEPVDIFFNDLLNSFGSESLVARCFELCMERARPGTLLIADNALRRGEVIQPAGQGARNVARYNELIAGSDRLEGLVIPIRDGLSVARLKD